MHTLEKIREITAIARNIVVIGFILSLGYYVPKIVSSVSGATTAIGYTSRKIDKFVETQTKSLDTEKNKKAIEAGIATAASLQGTIRLVNTTTIPQLNRTLLELQESTRGVTIGINKNLESTNNFIGSIKPKVEETFINVNGLLVKSSNSITSLTELINITSSKTSLTLDQLNSIIASPEWLEAIKHINESSNNVEELTRELKESGQYAPSIMKSLEEISTTSSKFRKATLLANIISAISRAFW